MNVTPRVFIVEGVCAPEKDRLVKCLYESMYPQTRPVVMLNADATLGGGWHSQLPRIHVLRLRVLRSIVDRLEADVARSPDRIYIIDRLHASYAAWRRADHDASARLERTHRMLVDRLARLPVLVLHSFARTCGSAAAAEQDAIGRVIEADPLPFRRLQAEPGQDPLATLLN
jgi:hypothetical protein